ncbi:MAG: acylphosphatase [Acidimicrobiia bacterium]
MADVRRRVIVTGRVQGVFFRESCKQLAQATGVRGWVRNLDNGDVEAVFEGEQIAVEAMVSWCRVGPARARVDAVKVTNEAPGRETAFRVTR